VQAHVETTIHFNNLNDKNNNILYNGDPSAISDILDTQVSDAPSKLGSITQMES